MNLLNRKGQFETEQARLVKALGRVTEGGIEEFIDFLLTDMDDVWRYRREPLVLRSREKMSLRSDSAIPFLAPELVLLFKSKNTSSHARSKDASDFEKACPHLEPERRAWLCWALTAISPDHPWIRELVPS
jgi:hypothetical protein